MKDVGICEHGVPMDVVCDACRWKYRDALDVAEPVPHFGRPPERFLTCANPDYEVVTFMNKDGSMDCVIHEKSGREAMHAYIPAPPMGRCISVIRGVGGAIQVIYRDEETK